MARRTKIQEDTTAGKILALALLANAPIFVGFVLVLLITQGDTSASRRFAPVVLWVTPLFAVMSLGIFIRAPRERKMHRASRIGVILAVVALLMWVLVLVPSLRL